MLTRAKSAVWLGLEYIWYPILVVLTTPHFLQKLGSEHYGHWMFLNSILGLGAIINAGNSVAVIKHVADQLAKGDRAEVEKTFRSSLAISIAGGGLFAALIYVILGTVGATIFSKFASPGVIQSTATVGAALIWIEQIDNVCTSTIKAAELFGVAAKAEVAAKTLQILLALTALHFEADLTTLFGALAIGAVLRMGLKMYVVRRVLDIRNFRPTFSGVRRLLDLARWGWMQGIASICYGVSDRMLIGAALGATSLTNYSLATQLAQQSHAFTAAIMSLVFPAVSRRLATDATSSVQRIYRYASAASLGISGSLTAGLLIYGDRILQLWLGPSTAQAVLPTLMILSVAYWLLALSIVPYYLLLGSGKARETALINLVAGILMILSMAILVQSLEINGIGIARIIYGLVAAGATTYIAHCTMSKMVDGR